jgi:hypothetical protein
MEPGFDDEERDGVRYSSRAREGEDTRYFLEAGSGRGLLPESLRIEQTCTMVNGPSTSPEPCGHLLLGVTVEMARPDAFAREIMSVRD